MGKETIIQIKTLNNKSRKGQYLYIKEPGQRGSYYKYKPENSIESYVIYHTTKNRKGITPRKINEEINRRLTGKRNRIPQTHKNANRATTTYIRKITRRGTINKAIKKGITTHTLKETRRNQKRITQAKKELIESLTIDKTLLPLIIKNQNFDKLKTRLEYRISLKDKEGNTLAESFEHGKTIEDITNKLEKIMTGASDKTINTSDPSGKLIRRFQFYGINKPKILRNGTTKRIETKIIFRKG